jgi:hypothetical protein
MKFAMFSNVRSLKFCVRWLLELNPWYIPIYKAASEELNYSRLFLKLLEAVLRTGNRMNVGTNRGDAKAFRLDTLLKPVDI